MKTVIRETDRMFDAAAEQIRSLLRRKPDAVLAVAAGRTMPPLWKRLGDVSFAKARLFQVSEFIGVSPEKSLRHLTESQLLSCTDLPAANCCWLSEETFASYDRLIAEAGGLDLAILGIGCNAHIGLNEPATQYDTRTRKQKLTEPTRRQYAWLFGDAEHAPEWGLTMGIHTLVDAGEIMVLASGEEKARAVFDMLYARDDSIIPAAFLQLPPEVTVYADVEAGCRL